MFAFIQDPVTISDNCLNGQDIRANYELSYTTECGTPITTCVVNGTECSNGRCLHELQSDVADSRCQPPVFQFSGVDVIVSVSARNIVGTSNSAASRNVSKFFHLISHYAYTQLQFCLLSLHR